MPDNTSYSSAGGRPTRIGSQTPHMPPNGTLSTAQHEQGLVFTLARISRTGRGTPVSPIVRHRVTGCCRLPGPGQIRRSPPPVSESRILGSLAPTTPPTGAGRR